LEVAFISYVNITLDTRWDKWDPIECSLSCTFL